jgi:glutamate N-acetyltransferase/amino-acid N-acetyltransferase
MTTRKGAYDREAFKEALKQVMLKLALDIVKDGEGATKAVAFVVTGAKDDKEARIVGKNLTNSLLVKTALFGEDPNWGRIASTVGASKVECSEESLKISFENVVVYDRGKIIFDEETEKRAHEIMKRREFKIYVDLGVGEGAFTAYGCDLSYDYVKINAEYRT